MGKRISKPQKGRASGYRQSKKEDLPILNLNPALKPDFEAGHHVYLKTNSTCIHSHELSGPWLVLEKNNAVHFARDPDDALAETFVFCNDCMDSVVNG